MPAVAFGTAFLVGIGLLIERKVSASSRLIILLGLVAGLAILARLDAALAVVGGLVLLTLVLLREGRRNELIVRIAPRLVAGMTILLVPWAVWNITSFDSLVTPGAVLPRS